MPTAVLHCPSCGAVLTEDSIQCQYCRALLQAVACPSCFGLMFLGSKHCPHCGAKTAPSSPEPPKDRICPRCAVQLQPIDVRDTRLEQCPRCGGLWAASETFERICRDREAQAVAVAMSLPPPVETDEQVRYLKCPRCSQLMNRKNYAHRSGIIVDLCREHGIWFDREELRRIIEFIRAGGLDRARQIEKEHLDRARQQKELDRAARTSLCAAESGPDGDEDSSDGLLGGIASVLRWLFP